MMTNQITPQLPARKVTVSTSARLHMGFFNLNSKFGGLGASIDAPCTQVEITQSEKLSIDAISNESVAKIVENLIKSLKITQKFSLKIHQAIPEHAGLGSGTQMAVAIGAGLNALFNLNLSVTQIALAAKRGKRSGIGIGAFAQGGFLVDSGKVNDALPDILLRESFPENWRVLLVLDSGHIGVHGAVELQAFQRLKLAQASLHEMVLEHMLPALQRADLLAFGTYMADLQAYNGDYFSPIQGGRYASYDVEEVLIWLQTNGAACVGQSSWGPTGFAIMESEQQAETLQAQAQLAFAGKSNISFQCCRGKNTGASIQLG
jgi:beta-ribofuranosylaminobenzene 5'-phosphate synthase